MFEGHDLLVSLDHDAPPVREYVASVLAHWLDRGADGWRLDAAYQIPHSFWAAVLPGVRERHPNAWFVGEVIHGDYREFVAESGLDSVTQYELWKSIWSALNDANLHELAWNLGRHGELLASFTPLTFVGNHDVTRIASKLTNPTHLGHAVAVLMTVGGVPSVYAGDEQAFTGVKEEREHGDDAVRPPFPDTPTDLAPFGGPTHEVHQRLIGLRRRHPWLVHARRPSSTSPTPRSPCAPSPATAAPASSSSSRLTTSRSAFRPSSQARSSSRPHPRTIRSRCPHTPGASSPAEPRRCQKCRAPTCSRRSRQPEHGGQRSVHDGWWRFPCTVHRNSPSAWSDQINPHRSTAARDAVLRRAHLRRARHRHRVAGAGTAAGPSHRAGSARDYPAAFTAVASAAGEDLERIRAAHDTTRDTGTGWYLVSRPARPAPPIEIEQRITTARHVDDLEQVEKELRELRAVEGDLDIDDPRVEVYDAAIDVLESQLRATALDSKTVTDSNEYVPVADRLQRYSAPWNGPVVDAWRKTLRRRPSCPPSCGCAG